VESDFVGIGATEGVIQMVANLYRGREHVQIWNRDRVLVIHRGSLGHRGTLGEREVGLALAFIVGSAW